jgi:nitroreductase
MTNANDWPEAYRMILSRRSIREFTEEPVSEEMLRAILMAGAQAPSGKNNQPWRFVVVRDPDMKMLLAGETLYGRTVARASVIIPVFIDHKDMYDALKDHQAIGACLENILLAAHALGLGGVWLGEILRNKEAVRKHLGLESHYELMAVLAIGHPQEAGIKTGRKNLDELILKKFE